MKKYLGLLAVLAITLLACAQIAKAENTMDASSIANSLEKSADKNTKNLTPEQKRAYLESRAKAEANFKISHDEALGQMKKTGEDMQKENETMRREAKVKMDALRNNIGKEKDKAKAKIKEARIAVREDALKRFDGAIEKINSLNDRVKMQISKLQAKGVDVSVAVSFEATVEVKLADAKTKIASASALLSTSTSELTADNKTALKALAKDIETSIKDTHQALNDAIKSLKDTMKIKMKTEMNTKAETSDTTPVRTTDSVQSGEENNQ